MLLPIHDAVLLEIDAYDLESVAAVLRRTLTELPKPFAVPLEVRLRRIGERSVLEEIRTQTDD